MKYTILAFSENNPGVLYRISDLFLKRNINIESLTVSETETLGISRFTIYVNVDERTINTLTKQLFRIIEVVDIYYFQDADILFKEIAFIKLKKVTSDKIQYLKTIVVNNNATIASEKTQIVIEKVGTEKEVDALVKDLRTFGIAEFIRSGRSAIKK